MRYGGGGINWQLTEIFMKLSSWLWLHLYLEHNESVQDLSHLYAFTTRLLNTLKVGPNEKNEQMQQMLAIHLNVEINISF